MATYNYDRYAIQQSWEFMHRLKELQQ